MDLFFFEEVSTDYRKHSIYSTHYVLFRANRLLTVRGYKGTPALPAALMPQAENNTCLIFRLKSGAFHQKKS